MSVNDLPAVNASLNALSTVFLTMGYFFIRRQNQRAHRNCMVAAFVTSTIFLVCYLVYHASAGHTRFLEPAWFKPIYLFILLTHIPLAGLQAPLILVTLFLGLKGRNEAHKKIARWTWPIWMYVSVTGVIIYLLLYQVFPQAR